MLNATSIHADLAKRLLRFYPKMINDVYMCDEYYGKKTRVEVDEAQLKLISVKHPYILCPRLGAE